MIVRKAKKSSMQTFIMSGPCGSGKTHKAADLARMLHSEGRSGRIISTDHFFCGLRGGLRFQDVDSEDVRAALLSYKFDGAMLGEGHAHTRDLFRSVLNGEFSEDVLIIDNTNISAAEKAVYYDHASDYGVVTIIRMETPLKVCLRRNTHKVPDETIRRMHYMHHARTHSGSLRETMPWWNTVSE